jgi:hypothetical protein
MIAKESANKRGGGKKEGVKDWYEREREKEREADY